jgi:phospholipase/carboxylesterase
MADHDKVVVEPDATPQAAVILMHGLGADGHDFESLVPELRLPAAPAIRWIFPHAPVRPVTVNGGYRMRAWYDIAAIDPDAPEDRNGIRESAQSIGAFISAQRDNGIPTGRIVLAGFSQGGALALFAALRWPEPLAGVAAMSCYLPLAATLATEAHPANAAIPVFMAHGTDDPVVQFSLGEAARDLLLSTGYDVAWHSYRMEHEICTQEVRDLREWLLRILAVDR